MRQTIAFLLLCSSLCCLGNMERIPRRWDIEEIIHKTTHKEEYPSKSVTSPFTDTGHATICGPKELKADLSWSPKILDSSTKALDVYINMDTTVGLNTGSVHLTVAEKVDPSVPLIDVTKAAKCTDLEMYGIKNITCPIKPKSDVKAFYHAEGLPDMIPPGTYIVTVKITNNADQLFLCANLTITRKDDKVHYNYWRDKTARQRWNFLKGNY